MKNAKAVVRLLKDGAVIVRDCLKGVTTFRVINGLVVKRFPLELLVWLKGKEVVVFKGMGRLYSVYVLKKGFDDGDGTL